MSVTRAREVSWLPALVMLGLAASCSGEVGDAGSDVQDVARDPTGSDADAADADAADGETDAGPPVAGPLTLVASQVAFLLDRLCDLDGDGLGDNAIADLGSPNAEMVAAALGAAAIEEATRKPGLHFPSIDDLRGPSDPDMIVVPIIALDTDVPADDSDDFTGDEPFYAGAQGLDACGEPAVVDRGVRLEVGQISDAAIERIIIAPDLVEIRDARLFGSIEPLGTGAEMQACGHVLAREAGAAPGVSRMGAEETFSALEMLLAGGAAFGMPALAGISPNVDLDGDGLERFMLDPSGHLATCVDGDGRIVEGRDCWRDPGMADGFGLVVGVELVRGVLVGRAPGWEYDVPVTCDGGLPAESVFALGESGPGCAGLDEPCDPRSASACCDPSHRCSGANGDDYRCFAPCDAAPCPYGEMAGRCAAGFCGPVGGHVAPSDCEADDPCTTEYGVTEGTACVDMDGTNRCVATCIGEAEQCVDEQHTCLPLVHGDGGVCMVRPPEAG